MQAFPHLSPCLETLVDSGGEKVDIPCLDGTVAVTYKGVTYNIPLRVGLPSYPHHAPLITVMPTSTMVIRPRRYVDSGGKVYLPLLNNWKHPGSSLFEVLQLLAIRCTEEPPVFSSPSSKTVSDPYPGAAEVGVLKSWLLGQLSKHRYLRNEEVVIDVANVLMKYTDLRVTSETFSGGQGNNAFKSKLLQINGTLPVKHEDSVYDVPISIWLLHTHPVAPPLVSVRDAAHSVIRISSNVNIKGEITHAYLDHWQYPGSNLCDLLADLIQMFSQQLPLLLEKRSGHSRPAMSQPYPSLYPYPGAGPYPGTSGGYQTGPYPAQTGPYPAGYPSLPAGYGGYGGIGPYPESSARYPGVSMATILSAQSTPPPGYGASPLPPKPSPYKPERPPRKTKTASTPPDTGDCSTESNTSPPPDTSSKLTRQVTAAKQKVKDKATPQPGHVTSSSQSESKQPDHVTPSNQSESRQTDHVTPSNQSESRQADHVTPSSQSEFRQADEMLLETLDQGKQVNLEQEMSDCYGRLRKLFDSRGFFVSEVSGSCGLSIASHCLSIPEFPLALMPPSLFAALPDTVVSPDTKRELEFLGMCEASAASLIQDLRESEDGQKLRHVLVSLSSLHPDLYRRAERSHRDGTERHVTSGCQRCDSLLNVSSDQASTQCLIVSALRICREDLTETLDVEPVVSALYARFCLTVQEKQHVDRRLREFGTIRAASQTLDYLEQKPESQLTQLMEILDKKQPEIHSLVCETMEKIRRGELMSMISNDEVQRTALRWHSEDLSELLDPQSLTSDLYSQGCLTQQEKEHLDRLESGEGKTTASRRLLRYMEGKSEKRLGMFLEVLRQECAEVYRQVTDTMERVKRGYIPVMVFRAEEDD